MKKRNRISFRRNEIKFEGEFLGRKYWNGFFRGNYEIKNGNGYIKEYNSKGVLLLFEGEYKNGERIGKGKEYLDFGDHLVFEREYKNGKRNGKIKEYDGGVLIFEGEYLYNCKKKVKNMIIKVN